MSRFYAYLLVLGAIQVLHSHSYIHSHVHLYDYSNDDEDRQFVPEECLEPPRGVDLHPMDCCPMPQLFNDRFYPRCGLTIPRKFSRTIYFDTKSFPTEYDVPVCKMYPDWIKSDQINCLFDLSEIYDWMIPDTHKNLKHHFRKVGRVFPYFNETLIKASEFCFKTWSCPMVFKSMSDKAFHFRQRCAFCVTREILINCPTWKKTEDCGILRKHLDHCRKYFYYKRYRW